MKDTTFIVLLLVILLPVSKYFIDYGVRHPEGYLALIVVLVDYACLCVLWGCVMIAALLFINTVFNDSWVLPLTIVGAGVFAMYYRFKQKQVAALKRGRDDEAPPPHSSASP